jgi:phospholipase C
MKARKPLKWVTAVALTLFAGSAFGQGRVDHIFIIVKENRSFDSYFGTFQNVAGLSGAGAQPIGQCTSAAAADGLQGCYSDADCGGTVGACLRGTALEGNLTAKLSKGGTKVLVHNYAAGKDFSCTHTFGAGFKDVNGGQMNGFDAQCGGGNGATAPFTYYNHTDFCGYAGGTLTNGLCSLPTIWNYAQQGTLMDHFFASMLGPSYPNHLYFIAGQSNEAVNNPIGGEGGPNNWNCDSAILSGGTVTTPQPPYNPPYVYPINVGSYTASTSQMYLGGQCNASADAGKQGNACACYGKAGSVNSPPTLCTDTPDCGVTNADNCSALNNSKISGCVGGSKGCICPNITTIGDEMDAAGVTWKYYAQTAGSNGYQWNPISYIQHLRFGNDWANNVAYPGKNSKDTSSITSSSKFYQDVTACTTAPTCSSLAQVVWLSTGQPQNGHPGGSTNVVQADQSWTASVVQTIEQNSTVYNHSIIFITWDDWGGFYDHIAPNVISNTSWGIRVGAICVGPFCQNGISHANYEFSSFLKCIENPPASTITAWSITGNIATFTVLNGFVAGENVTLSGFPTSTFFNGQTVAVLSSGLSSTQFEADFTHANGNAAETGNAAEWAVSNLGQQDTNANVNNVCAPPGTVTGGEWTSGGVINLAGGGG